MTQEDEQIQQRRANLEALARLGVRPYPHRFERTHSVSDLVRAHAATPAADLEASRVETTTAGRVMVIRSFGKANFLVLSDGRAADPGVRAEGRAVRSATSRWCACSISVTTSVSRDTCSAPRPTS